MGKSTSSATHLFANKHHFYIILYYTARLFPKMGSARESVWQVSVLEVPLHIKSSQYKSKQCISVSMYDLISSTDKFEWRSIYGQTKPKSWILGIWTTFHSNHELQLSSAFEIPWMFHLKPFFLQPCWWNTFQWLKCIWFTNSRCEMEQMCQHWWYFVAILHYIFKWRKLQGWSFYLSMAVFVLRFELF